MPKVFNTPGHVHALTFSCYRRLPLLKSERTCRWLAESIEAVRKNHDVAVFAYVFMPEHVHLAIQPRQATYDMAAIRKAIKHPVSRRALAWLTEHGLEFLLTVDVVGW